MLSLVNSIFLSHLRGNYLFKITGHQWYWHYDYLDEGLSFSSNISTPMSERQRDAVKNPNYLRQVDNPLVVPVHQKILFLITAADVIHAWWVPELGVKRDAIPGFVQQSWTKIEEPGIYRGQCSVLCGVNHGFMPIVVEAVSEKDYVAWLKKEKQKEKEKAAEDKASGSQVFALADLMSAGKTLYEKNCMACHQDKGQGIPPAFPALAGSKMITGPVLVHIKRVINGSPPRMPAFGAQLSDKEIAEIVTYERNSWGNDDKGKYGNDAGGVVQPKDVKAAR